MNEATSQAARGTTRLPASPLALASDLEELRRSVIRHLDSLEALASRAGGGRDWSDPDTARARELAAKLENDRLLLAAAWERLERERLEAHVPRPGHGSAVAPRGVRPAEATPAPERTAARPAAPNAAAANPVADSILRQFQTLCSDVRRTTDARFSSR